MATPDLLTQLNTTGLQRSNPRLYQVLSGLIQNNNVVFNAPSTNTNVSPPIIVGGITLLTGDVTTPPGGGSVIATVAPNAVTLAKMQQISSPGVIGRATAGIGNLEVLAGTQILDFIGSVLGDLLYRDSASWQVLQGNITTTRKFLSMIGDGSNAAAPEWVSIPSSGLPDSGVTPGTYGDATHVGQFTVNSKGILTAASNVSISSSPPVTGQAYVPVSDGGTTPIIINDGAGNFIFVAYNP